MSALIGHFAAKSLRQTLGPEKSAFVQGAVTEVVGTLIPPLGKAYDVLDALTPKRK